MTKPPRTPPDDGFELIARYESAIIDARMERLSADLDPDDVARERADVAALAARIGAGLRADYHARRQP
jgi:hypothetical protein